MIPTMHITTSKNKLVLVLIPALLICQIIAFCLTLFLSWDLAKRDLVEDVVSSIEVFKYASTQRATHLMQAADLVGRDFGFREAIASNQAKTINSVLVNQKSRVGADVAVLTSLDGKILGTSIERNNSYNHGALDFVFSLSVKDIDRTSLNLRTLEVQNDKVLLYQWVQAVIKSPIPVAKLSFAFEINDESAQRFRKITNSDFLFMSRERGEKWHLHASSFPLSITKMILNSPQDKRGYISLSNSGESFGVQLVEMSNHEGIQTIMAVGQSLEKRVAPYRKLVWIFGFLILISAVASSFIIYRLTGKVVTALDEVAFKDDLTKIANRRMFDKHFLLLSQDFQAFSTGYTLMVLDLNKFKQVNDTHGHAAGDRVLKEVAKRLRGLVRSGDTVARLGGDEFAVLLVTNDRGKVAEIAGNIVEKIREPIPFENVDLEVGASIGIAMAPYNGHNSDEIFGYADSAMYVAKKGNTGFQFANKRSISNAKSF